MEALNAELVEHRSRTIQCVLLVMWLEQDQTQVEKQGSSTWQLTHLDFV